MIKKDKRNLPISLKIIRRAFISLFSLFLLPLYYAIGLLPRNKNLWIFCSWFGQRYSDNSRLLFEYVSQHCPAIRAVWLSKNRDVVVQVRGKGFRAYPVHSLRSLAFLLRAGKIFSTTGGEIPLFFCRGTEYYALWHGMPLKRILEDDRHSGGSEAHGSFMKLYVRTARKLFPWKSLTDQKNLYTVTNSEFFVPFLRTAFGLPVGRILRTGSPRCDALFRPHTEELIERIHGQFPGDKIILYMPTFRTAEWTGEVFNPFDEKYGFDMDEFLATLARHKSVLVYKPHFYDARFMQSVRQKDSETLSRFILVGDADYDELYNFVGQVDMLMTDYSSIYFDFIATGKPVVLLPFDYEDYLTYARAHYFDYWDNMEGEKARSWQEFYRILDAGTYRPVSDAARHKFAEYVNGECCKKLYGKIVDEDCILQDCK